MARKLLLYPERKRCRTCRRYFAFIVVLRQDCSEECAGLPEYPRSAEELPRRCRVWDSRESCWRPKIVYWTEPDAQRAARKQRSFWYLCDRETGGCGEYHLSKLSPEAYKARQEVSPR